MRIGSFKLLLGASRLTRPMVLFPNVARDRPSSFEASEAFSFPILCTVLPFCVLRCPSLAKQPCWCNFPTQSQKSPKLNILFSYGCAHHLPSIQHEPNSSQ